MGEASCQSFINESVSKVGSKPTSEMTQYHLNLIFAIIFKRKKSGKKNFRSRLWYHRRHIQMVTEYNKGRNKVRNNKESYNCICKKFGCFSAQVK